MKNKQTLIIIGLLILIGYLYIAIARPFNLFPKSSSQTPSRILNSQDGSKEKFDYLAVQTTNSCGLQANVLLSYSNDKHLQGSCCGPMSFHEYQEQIEGLKNYLHISQVPKDPYDVPVTLAKELLGYKTSIQLTPDQQAVYDQAMKLSHEGGPCCCKCWRWDAFEGQAKYLITKYNFSAQQIAEVWDVEDGCGGDEHHH